MRLLSAIPAVRQGDRGANLGHGFAEERALRRNDCSLQMSGQQYHAQSIGNALVVLILDAVYSGISDLFSRGLGTVTRCTLGSARSAAQAKERETKQQQS